jgi:hypothetical protein
MQHMNYHFSAHSGPVSAEKVATLAACVSACSLLQVELHFIHHAVVRFFYHGNPAMHACNAGSFWTAGSSAVHSSAALAWSPRKTPPHNPIGDNSIAASMNFIHQQLDCFGPERRLLGKYQLLGKKERRTGGTAPNS